MKTKLFFLTLTLVSFSAWTQVSLKDLNKKPKANLVLKLKSTEGTNGSALAWSPTSKVYCSVIAGNGDFPLDLFSESGVHLQTTNAWEDMRGLWFNPVYSVFEGNTYTYGDVVSFGIEAGKLIEEEPLFELMELPIPDKQLVLTLNTAKNQLVYLNRNASSIHFINSESGESLKELSIKFPCPSDEINYTSLIYTGVSEAPYGVLNYAKKLIYLYSDNGGNPVITIKLPKGAVTNDMFRFSFANNHVWLYDVNSRSWTGYKITKK